MEVSVPRSHVELSLEERKILGRLLHHKTRVAAIAHVLSGHRSTIYREIRCNWWHDAEVPQADGYRSLTAQKLAADRRDRKLIRHPDLLEAVVDRFKTGWSPEEIAGRMNAEPGSTHHLCQPRTLGVKLCLLPDSPAMARPHKPEHELRKVWDELHVPPAERAKVTATAVAAGHCLAAPAA
ncbi:hypothetical protein GCM10011452_28310 [Gemmobacter lanyuensis]|uniref:IS30 family transposase n=1 Tax=Gemmobacter lanyuensis TaxID=1054497 RepID=A0A918MMW4_9RHOB|nr:helix-turn-helix domain-containing protein [Gemmobacter lanyuensis]GGW38318.1 hypothetical protein GCM10011452_28310 [Gemmobacter lanyuensis]